MKEFFEIDEFKKIDEFKEIKAENYSNLKETFFSKEFKNDIDENYSNEKASTDENDTTNALVNENQDFNKNDFSNDINNPTSNLNTNVESITNSVPTNIISKVSTAVGTAAATAVGSIGTVIVCSNLLISAPKVEIVSIDTGADYVYYDVDISDLSDDVVYTLIIENGYGTYKFAVEEGNNSNLVSGLKPYCKYNISLVSDNKDMGGYRTYYEKSFYTKKASKPNAILNYELVPDYENNMLNLDYNVYISDYYKQGIDYYYTISYKDEVVYTNDELTKEYYFNGTLNNISEGDYVFSYYCNLYGEDIVVGTDTISVIMPDDLVPPVIDYQIDNVVMTGNYNDGYDLDIELSGYNSNASYELEIISDSFNRTFELSKKSINLNSLPIDYESCKINLVINDDIRYEYSLVDLVGINVTYSNPTYSASDNLSVLDYQLEGLDDESGITVSVTNNYNEDNVYSLENNKVYVDLSGEVLLTTIVEKENLVLKFNHKFDLGNKIAVDDLVYANSKESRVLFVKLTKYLPASSNIYLTCDGTRLEEALDYSYMEGYYAFNCPNLTDENIIEIGAEIEGNIIDCGEDRYHIDTNYEIPEYSIISGDLDNNEILNPNVYMISYNDDTYNAYIPINFESRDENLWYRIIINNEIYFDSRDCIYLLKDLDFNKDYSFKFEIYYKYNDVSYLIEEIYTSSMLNINNSNPEVEVLFDNSASTINVVVSNYEIDKLITVTYKDSTSEEVLLDNDFTAIYDNNKIISYITINYSDKIVDETMLNDNNVSLIGKKYKEYIISLEPYEFVAESISYRTLEEYDNDGTSSTNSYLYIKSSKLQEEGYSIYLMQDTTKYDPIENKAEGYFVFNVNTLVKDMNFDIKVVDNNAELVNVGNNTTFTVISDTSTLQTPTAWQYPNPGDSLLTYNDDNTFNAYIPINFESSDENVWYRVILRDTLMYDSTDYIAVIEDLDSANAYWIRYEIYYEYNGISYCINTEQPSGSIYATPTSNSMSVSYNHSDATFVIYGLSDPISDDILLTYTDETTEIVTLDVDGIGRYNNEKILSTITIYYCFSKVDKTNFSGITFKGNEYAEYVFELDPPYNLVIDEVSYGTSTNNYLYIYSSKVNEDGYSLYLNQDGTYFYPLENEKESWFVFDISSMILDTSFDILVENQEGYDVPLFTKVSYSITSQIPEYAVSEFNASDTMITYNDDNTFNAYIPINFECTDEALWYKLYLNDEMVAECRDYLTTVQNLDSTKTYQIKYEIYYENNGIVYYIEGNTITGEISVSSDLTSATATFDYDNSTIELANINYDIDSNVLVTYKDTTTQTIALDNTLKGSYDNSRVIDYITISYSIKAVDETLLNDKNIPLLGNKYKDYIINVDAYEFVTESISYRTLEEYDNDGTSSTNSYLYVKSSKLQEEGYSIYLMQNTTKYDPIENKAGGYFVFNVNTLVKDMNFDIKVLDNTGELVKVGNNTTFTVISDTSTLQTPTAWQFPNPGDSLLTYNDDNTFNAYIPINFESSDENVWYRIILRDTLMYDSTDYILLIENLEPTIAYWIRYEIYYEYNGISYCIINEQPSGSIIVDFDLSTVGITLDETQSTFNVDISYELSEKAIVTYTDGTSEEVLISDYSGTYDNTKTIKNVTIYYKEYTNSYSLKESTLIELGITIKGNVYNEYVIEVNS